MTPPILALLTVQSAENFAQISRYDFSIYL